MYLSNVIAQTKLMIWIQWVLIWDNYKVSIMRSMPWSQTHNSGKQSPKLLRLAQTVWRGKSHCKAELGSASSGDKLRKGRALWCLENTSCGFKPWMKRGLGKTLRLHFLICKMGTIALASQNPILARHKQTSKKELCCLCRPPLEEGGDAVDDTITPCELPRWGPADLFPPASVME